MPPRSRHATALALLSAALLTTACISGPISNGAFSFDTPNERVSGSFSGQVAIAPLSGPTATPVLPTPVATATATTEPLATATAPPAATATSVPPTATLAPPTATSTPPADGLLPAVDPPFPGMVPGGALKPIEIQAWWVDQGTATRPANPLDAFGHIHVTAMLPYGEESGITGSMNIPIRVVLHNNPSVFTNLDIQMDDGNVQKRIGNEQFFTRTCPFDGTVDRECTFSFNYPINTPLYNDGWKQFYLIAGTTTPDGNSFRTSSRIPVYFRNGKPVTPPGKPDDRFGGCETTSVLGRAWYDLDVPDSYANPRAICIPMEPISGVHQQKFVGGAAVDTKRLTVTLSKNHPIPAAGPWLAQTARTGRVIFDQAGAFGSQFIVPIDTRTMQNGWHSVQVKVLHTNQTLVSVCSYCDDFADSLLGVTQYWVHVNNP